jgi:hypothetical protein
VHIRGVAGENFQAGVMQTCYEGVDKCIVPVYVHFRPPRDASSADKNKCFIRVHPECVVVQKPKGLSAIEVVWELHPGDAATESNHRYEFEGVDGMSGEFAQGEKHEKRWGWRSRHPQQPDPKGTAYNLKVKVDGNDICELDPTIINKP